MGKIIPSKKQWKKWTLPAKASYLGFRLGILLTVLLWALPPIDYSIFIKDSKPAFSKTDKDFKILIMSFHGFGNSDNDIGEVLKHRLDSLKKADNLYISTYYLNKAISSNFNVDSAEACLKDKLKRKGIKVERLICQLFVGSIFQKFNSLHWRFGK